MHCNVSTMARKFANKNKFEFFKNALECFVLCFGQYYMWYQWGARVSDIWQHDSLTRVTK